MVFNSAFIEAAGPVRDVEKCGSYSLPPTLQKKPFSFAGELVPIKRPDIEAELTFHINYLLYDARGALTEWLTERGRYTWQFEETFAKAGIPKEFALLSPVMAGLPNRAEFKGQGAGWWFLSKPCSAAEGIDMSEDGWHDDRFDLELSTKCFASRIKQVHSELGQKSWVMATAAYLASPKSIKEFQEKWGTDIFWDLPLPDSIREIIYRWTAFVIINENRDYYGLRFQDHTPFTYDLISSVELSKDLPVGDLAKLMGISPREVLELNPKLRVANPVFPAKLNGKTVLHTIATPKDKGNNVLKKLKDTGYLSK